MAWRTTPRQILVTLLVAIGLFAAVSFLLFGKKEQSFGVTFSPEYATELGLDWHEAYSAMLVDLHPLVVRIPMPWNRVEPVSGEYQITDYDWMLAQAQQNGVQVILAIGMKVPRWPECQAPSWTTALSQQELTNALLGLEQHIVLAYRDHPALLRWQVENEPLFPFGECPLPNIDRLREEVELVRDLDPGHPIVLTSSGEQANWLELSSLADVVGASLYRFTWSAALGPVVFPHSPLYYRAQAWIVSLVAGDPVVISELQMEPWFADGIGDTQGDGVAFSETDFHEHVSFARATGISEVWLWGVEWWYREHLAGRSELWNAAKTLFAE